tara:strand:+ start:833 stop:1672 length:840 start_codon:yes stop_codon:yes gene_type:complete
MGLINQSDEQYYLGPDDEWNTWDENYGSYQFTPIKDIINNFIIAYVGEDKIISKVKRTDVAYHAQRGIAEFSFDTLKSVKSHEIEISPQLNMVLPKDYVNYVKVTYTDCSGLEHTIHPAIKTSNPLPILQDDRFQYIFNEQTQEVVTANESQTRKAFQKGKTKLGKVFYIDPIQNVMFFDSSMCEEVVTLKYISDGLGTDEEMQVHKFAEDALYKYIAHRILSTRNGVQEYVINRHKREAWSARRNAKLRLASFKMEEFTEHLKKRMNNGPKLPGSKTC